MSNISKYKAPDNIIFFRDFNGEGHTIHIKYINTFRLSLIRYFVGYVRSDGNYGHCYLDSDDSSDYVIYHGKVYTSFDFEKLILIINNENTARAIAELD